MTPVNVRDAEQPKPADVLRSGPKGNTSEALYTSTQEGTMPAESIKQRRVMAIAEHAPEKLHAKNKGLLKMSKGQLHDFASTKEKGLPRSVRKKK